jgi:putative addiction module component (TIGR02574 family)
MNSVAKQLYDSALGLPDSERADLAASLIESLDAGADADVAALWDAEIARRVRDLDSGDVTTVPWAEARRQILGAADDASHG